jgi:Nucleotidyltransferase/DNA polymerase involved in DNA repair
MTEFGVATVDDLLRFTEEELVARFGRWGVTLWQLARGIDERPVVSSHKRKSWSSENTFATDITLDEAGAWMREQAAKLWEALQSRGLVGRTVTVKLRSGAFETATRRLTPPTPPASAEDLATIGVELLQRFAFPEGTRYRLVGLGLSNFVEDEEESPSADEPVLFS